MNKDKIKADLLDKFDFEKAHEIMSLLNWYWADCNGVPDANQIRDCVSILIDDILEKDDMLSVSSGGFCVRKSCEMNDGELDVLTLSFEALKRHVFLSE